MSGKLHCDYCDKIFGATDKPVLRRYWKIIEENPPQIQGGEINFMVQTPQAPFWLAQTHDFCSLQCVHNYAHQQMKAEENATRDE